MSEFKPSTDACKLGRHEACARAGAYIDRPFYSPCHCECHAAGPKPPALVPASNPVPLVLGGLRCVEVEGWEPVRELHSINGAKDFISDGPASWSSRLKVGNTVVDVEWNLPLELGKSYRVTIEEEK